LATGMTPWASQLGSLSDKEQGTSDRPFDRNTIARAEFERVTPLLFQGIERLVQQCQAKARPFQRAPHRSQGQGVAQVTRNGLTIAPSVGWPSSDQHGGTPHDDGAAVGGQVSHTGSRLTADQHSKRAEHDGVRRSDAGC
jgi:hypothetical protein